MRRLRSKKTVAACLGVVMALGAATAAQAEIGQSGTIRVSFNGSIAPVKLPRTTPAPVSVIMGGKITTTTGDAPPKLEKIILDINRHGMLSTTGLATCSLSKLNSISAAGARKVCGSALIGHGNVTSRVTLPGQGTFAVPGPLQAFNGKSHGKPAIFAQVASGAPLPLTYVIVFTVGKTSGTFGTELSGTLPAIASEYGVISSFDMTLRRTYSVHGKKMSYASAFCPAPKGFTKATFPFARASYVFEDGQKVTSTLNRSCTVRG